VQTKLKQIPGVRDAVVISLHTGKGRQNELAALVATRLAVRELRLHIAASSEAYAIPKRMMVVEEIPLTFTGKHDRTVIERMLRSGKQKAVAPEFV
jgi:acyl-coenzyme A synthetase/AMP-(fatty) acid ligase